MLIQTLWAVFVDYDHGYIFMKVRFYAKTYFVYINNVTNILSNNATWISGLEFIVCLLSDKAACLDFYVWVVTEIWTPDVQ